MKFRSFLRDKAVFLTAYGLALSFVLVFLLVLRLSLYSIWFIAGVLVLAPAAGLLAEYMQKRAYYRQVADLLSHLDKKFLLMELLERPSFAEGEIFYEVLRRTGKAMNDEIAFYKRQSGEYREFVETWVHEIKTPIASSKLLIENHPDGVTDVYKRQPPHIPASPQSCPTRAWSGSAPPAPSPPGPRPGLAPRSGSFA